MLEVALKVLEKIEKHGFKAYIVGGFVRDYLLGNVTNDVDICTDATPMDIKLIFDNITLPRVDYGVVRVDIKKHRFDIMTFRKEISYYNNRKPMEVEYIKDLISNIHLSKIGVNKEDFEYNINDKNDFINSFDKIFDSKQIEVFQVSKWEYVYYKCLRLKKQLLIWRNLPRGIGQLPYGRTAAKWRSYLRSAHKWGGRYCRYSFVP